MKYAIIAKKDMPRWFDSLKRHGKIFGPRKKEHQYVFRPIDEFEEMSLVYIPTILPPKKYYFPQKEALLKFSIDPYKTDKAIKEFEEYILFAVHTCDIAGIQCLDVVFNDNPADPNYLNRKEKTTVIGIECMDYCDSHASCAAVGNHVPRGGYDIMLTDLDGSYAMHINSEKGEKLAVGKSYIREMNATDRARLKKAQDEKLKKFHNEFSKDIKSVERAFDDGFFSPVWQDVGRRCVGCTNCTAVCPTCYCFDIADEMEMNLNDGVRTRTWSYCQMDDFAKVATGEDFRPGRDGRQRHRYYRKFKYPVTKYNKYFCTGCGRCTRTCMAKISLVETVNALLDDKA
ncbi:MAG: 4Fe-4S dicluster domain-containing protein [Candidatus Velamenicoccus archaeovorus]